MAHDQYEESLMEASGLGLLPGVVVALGLVVVAMAALLTGSMWALVGVLVVLGACVAAIVVIMVALMTEGEAGERMRAHIPGLGERPPGRGVKHVPDR